MDLTIRKDLEGIRELLMKAYSRLGRYRKMNATAKHAAALKLIREHIYEGAEALEEFTERNFKK